VIDQTKISRDLAEIIDLEQRLLTQAVHNAGAIVDGHSLPGGNAMVSLAPVARISKWTDQVLEHERQWALDNPGAPIDQRPDWTADEDDDWEPALQTLRFWSDHYRRVLGMQYDLIPTIATEARFLRHESVLPWIVDHEPNVEHFAKDINRARRRLENVLHAGTRAERTRVECNHCEKQPQLIKVHGSTEEADRWKCPNCKHRYDGDALRRAHAAQLRRESAAKYVDWQDARATLVTLGRSERTIRKWMAPHVDEVDVCTECRCRWPRQEYAACPRKIKRKGEWTGQRCGGDLVQGWHGDREAVVQAYSEISTHRTLVWWPDLWTLHLTTQTRKRASA
jgi:transposase-like protein